MPNLPLEDLQRRINQRDSELQRLRQELESRQNQLDTLTQRKQELQAHLQQVEAEMASIAAGTQRPTAALPNPSLKRPAPKAPETGKPASGSLPALIIAMIRETGGPLTVKQLAQEAKRRGFKSKSRIFHNIVETRAYDLKRKGILQRAADQPGFILAESTNGQARAATPATHPAHEAPPRAAPKSVGKAKGMGAVPRTGNGKPMNFPAGKPNRRVGAAKQATLSEVLTQLLKRATKPLTGPELASQALRAGYRTTSKSFKDVVWVMLNQIANVEHIRNQGYRLKKAKR
jgi:hypothetical protein